MLTLQTWAARWQIPPQAMTELYVQLGLCVPPPTAGQAATSEAATQQQRVLRAAKAGGWLMRNNSGACEDSTGRQIRYGLANTSAQFNKVCKSSDLIGITPIIITPAHVGQRVGVFCAEEVKAPGWVFCASDDRAVAQLNFGKKVLSLGGIFKFVTRPDQED